MPNSTIHYIPLDSSLPELASPHLELVEKLMRNNSSSECINKLIECFKRQKRKNTRKSKLDVFAPLCVIDPLILAQIILIDPSNNDVAIECSLFLKYILLSIDYTNSYEHVVIINPSVKFISTWMNIRMLDKVKVTFIVHHKNLHTFLSMSKVVQNSKVVSFLLYGDINKKNWKASNFPNITAEKKRLKRTHYLNPSPSSCVTTS